MKHGCQPDPTFVLPASLIVLSASTALGQNGSGTFAGRLPGNWRWLEEYAIAGNEVWRILALFVFILLALLAGRIARYFTRGAAARFDRRGQALMAVMCRALARATGFVSLVAGLKAGLEVLILNPTVRAVSDGTMSVLAAIAVGYIAYCLVDVVDAWLRGISEKTPSKLDDMLVPLVRTSLRITIFVLVIVQIATILSEKPATSIIAGLGVGGLAVGLAAQDTIKNFFGSVMIFSDRPFELGDQIIVGDQTGNIEAVGFRSTRFRTLDGYLVTIPNGDLANRTLVNMSKRPNLKRTLTLSLSRKTPPEKIAAAVDIVKRILSGHEGSSPALQPRVFFSEITPMSLNVVANYWYHPPDPIAFSAFNERVNLEIVRQFAAQEIELAPPGG